MKISFFSKNKNIDDILKKLEDYFYESDFHSAINLCEEAILNFKEDYRLYSCLGKSYKNLLPFGLFNYDNITLSKRKLLFKYTNKAIHNYIQTILLILKNRQELDEDLFLTTQSLWELNTLPVAFYDDQSVKSLKLLEIELTKLYKTGNIEFDETFENFIGIQKIHLQ